MRWPFDTQGARRPRNRVAIPGWAPPSLQKSMHDLDSQLVAVQLREKQSSLLSLPGAIKGERLFAPDTTQTRTVAATAVNDILKSGQSYDIEVPYNAPGVFVGRSLVVSVTYRKWVAASNCAVWPNMYAGTAGMTTNVSSVDASGSKVVNYFWNLEDPRSGKRFGDDLMACTALLPPFTLEGSEIMQPGGRLMFDAPWLLERDSQLKFTFRPITDIVQTAAGGTENGTRNQTVRVRVEVHGTRFFTDQDAMRKGALIP